MSRMMHSCSEALKVYFCILILIVLLNYGLYYRKKLGTVVLQQHADDETLYFKMHTLTENETTLVMEEYDSESASSHEARESTFKLSTWRTTVDTVVTEVKEPKIKPINSTNVAAVSKQLMANSEKQQSESPATHVAAATKPGYVVALFIYEQQTMASGNLIQLQCWAKFLNLLVVKPFMYDSRFRLPLDEHKMALMVKPDDIFNMTDWNNHVTQQDYAPFVEWHQFLREAPRNVIYVQFKYPLLSAVKAKRLQGFLFPHPAEGNYYKTGCAFKQIDRASTFLTAKGFKTVRKVCVNFNNGDEPTLEEFRHHVLGDYAPGEVSIIMNEWRGLGENQRVLIRDRICIEENPFREQVKPSLQVISDAEQYRQRYLGGKDYLAVITRFEMSAITHRVHDRRGDDPHYIIPYCINLTEQAWKLLKRQKNLDKTFLAIDIGKYGSSSFERHSYYGHLKDMANFVSTIYDGKMNVQEWEKTFDDVAQITDPSYIAMLQKVIVTRAKCIIFVGGGSFQRHALHLYQQLHPNPEDQCIVSIVKCTSTFRPIQ